MFLFWLKLNIFKQFLMVLAHCPGQGTFNMHFQYAIWEQILLQTTLWFKIHSWYFFFPLEERITTSQRNTGQSIYWQHPERTRTDQNERLQEAFDGTQGAELKFERELEGHINNTARKKTENKIQLMQRCAGIVNSGGTFVSVLSVCAHLHVLVQRKGDGMSSSERTSLL